MSEENLKIVITGDASQLDKTSAEAAKSLDQVSQSAAAFDAKARAMNQSINYVDRSFKGAGKSFDVFKRGATEVPKALESTSGSAIRAQYAISGLERAARSGGLQGVVFGAQQTAREFTYLITQTGSVKGAFATLGKQIAGPAGFIVGATLIIEIVQSLIQKYGSLSAAIQHLTGNWTEADQAHKDFIDALKSSEKPFTTAITNVSELQGEMALANKGILSQKTVLDNYNKTLGTAFGKATNLKDAEQAITDNAAAYIQATLNKAVATAFFQKASDAVVKSVEAQNESASESATFWQKTMSFLTAGFNSANRSWNAVFKQYDQGVAGFAASNKRLAQLTGQNDFAKYSQDAQKYLTQAAQAFKGVFNQNGTGGGSKGLKSISDIMDKLKHDFATVSNLAKGLGLSEEQIGTAKIEALEKAIQSIAQTGGPKAVEMIKQLAAQIKDIQGSSFLPTLTGGRAQVNAPGITNPGVPKTAIGAPNLNTDSAKVRTAQQKELNDQFRDQLQLAGQLDSIFGDIFSTMANGGNALQGLIQAIEQLIIKLAAAAAAAAILNALTGGGAAGFGAIFGQLSGLTGIISSHAQGGYIPGPQLAVVGDAPGGEWVLNQKQISAILNGSGQRNSNMPSQITLRAAGADLVAVIDTNNRKQNRRG